MAISRKKSRRITMDGQLYHWAVSEDSNYSVLVVQSAQGVGQKLEVQVNWADDEHRTPTPITPGTVAICIQSALEKGWSPQDSVAKAFRCRLLPNRELVGLHSGC